MKARITQYDVLRILTSAGFGMSTAKIIVTIPDYGKRGKRCWARILTGVDRTKTTGYAFQGDWLTPGRMYELPIGTIVLLGWESGSVSRRVKMAALFCVNAGGLEEVVRAEGDDWALQLRDKAAELLTASGGPAVECGNRLAEFADDELIAELRRRGYVVNKPDDDEVVG